MASLVYAGVLNQSCFEGAMNFILAERLGSEHIPAALLRRAFDNAVAESAEIGVAARADLAAISLRSQAPANKTAVRSRNICRAGRRWSSASTSTRRHASAVAS